MVGIVGALDLPPEDLPAWTTGQYANLVVNNYPPQPEPPLPQQVRVGPHTDRGGFTLLAADDAPGGLEVRLPGSTEWIPVVIPPEAFLVQAGDLLSRWTNRVIRPNAHRVVNPPRDVAATARRQAVVYFHYPSLTHTVTPAPSCVARSGAPTLEPLHAGDHLMYRQAAFASSTAERYGDMEI
jgi:isopenicillin N synthase-like dioxygenase